MASISSMISFIVLLLATYSSSAPLVPELQNATSVPQVENATGAFQFSNVIVLARREVAEERAVTDTVGLSSSSSEDDTDKIVQTTEKLAVREMEDSLRSENNVEREADAESFDAKEDERSFTEDTFTTEMNHKRADDAESFDANENERSFTDETLTTEVNHERAIEVQSFESSTGEETTVEPSSEVKNAKRSSGSGSWLSAENADRTKRSSDSGSWLSAENADRTKRSSDSGSWLSAEDAERTKRSSGSGSWLSADSDDQVQKRSIEEETSTIEDSSVPSSSEAINTKRDMEQSPSLSAEASEEFNRRAIGSIEMNESSTIVAKIIESESTTDEQPSSSTEFTHEEVSSTVESETVVTPVDDSTRPSPVPSESKSKILAIIPGQISKSKIVIDPTTGKTAGFRPVHQVQLTQGQNETIAEDKKPNY